jgi:hemoglobin
MHDISTREDLERLLSAFYSRLLVQPGMDRIFRGIDMQRHLPVIVDFWETLLLGRVVYQGNVMQKHIPLGLESAHFDTWLSVFFQTVDAHFQGERAEEIKSRARSIAGVMKLKLGVE